MLLFFIAQMTAWADSCKSENINTIDMNYTIYMCNHGFEKEVEIAKKWWDSKGYKTTLADGVYNCKEGPRYGEIHIQFGNSKVREYDTNVSKAYAVTLKRHTSDDLTIKSANIYLSTDLLKDANEMQVFLVHEIGHSIGFQHVSENCQDYIMNPYFEGMGNKL